MAVLRQGEPKLKGVFAQHGLKGKGRAVIHALWVVKLISATSSAHSTTRTNCSMKSALRVFSTLRTSSEETCFMLCIL